MHHSLRSVMSTALSVAWCWLVSSRGAAAATLALLVLAVGATSGCRAPSEAPNDTQFAGLTHAGSRLALSHFYTQLKTQRHGQLCIGFVGFRADEETTRNYAVFALRSLRRWLSAVKASPAWELNGVPDITHRIQMEACRMAEATQPGQFAVTFFKTQAQFKSALCGSNSVYAATNGPVVTSPLSGLPCQDTVGYSVGTPGMPAIYISPLMGSRVRTNIEASVMHEFGHTFGLGDTYNALGVTYQGTMPPSLMRYSGGTSLYPDDQLGLENAIRVSMGQEPQCPGQVLPGTAGYFFCNPGKSALQNVNQHSQNEEQGGVITGVSQTQTPGSPSSSETDHAACSPAKGVHLVAIEFKQQTWLKTKATAQGKDLDEGSRCAIEANTPIKVRIFPHAQSANHCYYEAAELLQGCPPLPARSGYFYIPHVKSEEPVPEESL